MTSRIQDAIAEAMVHLKTSDVARATSKICDALMSASPSLQGSTSIPSPRAAVGRKLGDVLNGLRVHRGWSSSSIARRSGRVHEDNPRFKWRELSAAAGKLKYKLYIPENYVADPALVVMLHGCMQDPDDFARGTRMNHLAEEFGLIIAYPHQPRSANANGCWNWFDRRHQAAGSGEPAMLAALAEALAEEFGISPERVFAAGLSAGAAMADILAETYPEVFSKVGVHSGLPHRAAHDVISAFAAMKGDERSRLRSSDGRSARKIIIHGVADATVHPANGEELFERMRTRNSGSSIILSDTTTGGRRTKRQILFGAAGEVLAEHLRVEGAGHAWSGGDASGSFADPLGPDASREMVEFFLRD